MPLPHCPDLAECVLAIHDQHVGAVIPVAPCPLARDFWRGRADHLARVAGELLFALHNLAAVADVEASAQWPGESAELDAARAILKEYR